MGYTHYWRQTRNLNSEEWAALTEDFAEIFKYTQHVAAIPLADGMGDLGTQPEFVEDHVSFNGAGDDAHETFFIRRLRDPDDYEFCKTARSPYDVAVTACLCYLSTCLDTPAFHVSSDGNGGDFTDGLELARKALPRKANVLDLPMGIMQSDRWTAPWIHGLKGPYEVHFCINGKGYVLNSKANASYCFHSHLALAEFLESTKEAKFRNGGRLRMAGMTLTYGADEPNIWDATGSFDQTRQERILRAQQKALASLFPAPAENNEPPPAYVRPMDFIRPEDNNAFCYSLADVFKLYGTHEGVAT